MSHTATQVGAIDALLRAGAVIDYETLYRTTAVIAAAEAGQMAALRHLLNVGADPNYVTVAGLTAVMHASAKGQVEAIQVLAHALPCPSLSSSTATVS